MQFCQHLFAQLTLIAIYITHFKLLLYFSNLCHPDIALLFLVHLEQEIDISFSSLFYDLHENMVFVVMGSLILVHREFPPWCSSNSNL